MKRKGVVYNRSAIKAARWAARWAAGGMNLASGQYKTQVQTSARMHLACYASLQTLASKLATADYVTQSAVSEALLGL